MKEKRYRCIYKIESPNGRVYIGQTCDPKRRESQYRRLRNKSQKIIYRSIEKYGWDSHTFNVIIEGIYDLREIDMLEIENIKKYKNLGISMNISDGGNSHSYRLDSNGIPIIQTDLNLNIINKWNTAAEASRRLGLNKRVICDTSRSRRFYYAGYYWIRESDYSSSMKITHGRSDTVDIIELDCNLNEINRYKSINDAASKNNIDPRTLCSVIKRNKAYKGRVFVKSIGR